MAIVKKYPPLKPIKNVETFKGVKVDNADENFTLRTTDKHGRIRYMILTTRPRFIFLCPNTEKDKFVEAYKDDAQYMADAKANGELSKRKIEQRTAAKIAKDKEREAKKVAKKLAKNAAKIAALEAENKALK